jgi:hypothetical protein
VAVLATVLLATIGLAARRQKVPAHMESQFSFDYVLDTAGNIQQIKVLRNGEQVQLLDTCTGESIPRQNGLGELSREDFNFDGYPDLMMKAAIDREENSSYCIWLFNPSSQRFVLSEELSSMANPTPDPATKTVVSHKNEDCAGGCYDEETYSWSNGQLVLVRDEWQREDPTVGPARDCRFIRGGEKRKDGRMVPIGRIWVDVGGVMCLPHYY